MTDASGLLLTAFCVASFSYCYTCCSWQEGKQSEKTMRKLSPEVRLHKLCPQQHQFPPSCSEEDEPTLRRIWSDSKTRARKRNSCKHILTASYMNEWTLTARHRLTAGNLMTAASLTNMAAGKRAGFDFFFLWGSFQRMFHWSSLSSLFRHHNGLISLSSNLEKILIFLFKLQSGGNFYFCYSKADD